MDSSGPEATVEAYIAAIEDSDNSRLHALVHEDSPRRPLREAEDLAELSATLTESSVVEQSEDTATSTSRSSLSLTTKKRSWKRALNSARACQRKNLTFSQRSIQSRYGSVLLTLTRNSLKRIGNSFHCGKEPPQEVYRNQSIPGSMPNRMTCPAINRP